MSTFDIASFVQTSITGQLDTKVVPVEVGDYPGVAMKAEIKAPKDSVILEVYWKLTDNDGKIKAATGRENPTLKQSIFLDLTPQNTLDMSQGKNIGLGRLREAIGKNQPDVAFSWGDVIGCPALCRVGHRAADDGNKYDQINSVTSAG